MVPKIAKRTPKAIIGQKHAFSLGFYYSNSLLKKHFTGHSAVQLARSRNQEIIHEDADMSKLSMFEML